MSEMSRRRAVALLAVSPLLTVQAGAQPLVQLAPRQPAAEPAAPDSPAAEPELRFFTAHEFATVSVLADLVIPADERSGSATQAGVPAYMDFILYDTMGERARQALRGGLAWLDHESRRRFGKVFLELAAEQRTGILDDIAWPARARPEMSHGVAFFSQLRDLVVSGFFSSEMGVRDVGFLGNVAVAEWRGCPPEALARLGVSYGD